MKKVLIVFFTLCMMAVSCKVSNDVVYASNSEKTATGKSNELIFNSAKQTIDTISQYIDLSDYIDTGVRSASENSITFEDLANVLPHDAGKKRRLLSESSARSSANADISLEDELNKIVEDYYIQLERIIPDPSAAQKLDFVEIENGVLYISDDYGIPLKSPEGIATVEILNAFANGDDVDALIAQIEKDSLDVENESRGLWLASIKPWNGGDVNYRWGLESDMTSERKNYVKKLYVMSDDNKKATLAAMKKWNESTGGAVSFKELDRNLFTDVFSAINLIRVIYIFDADYTSSTTRGMSTVCNSGIYTLQRGLKNDFLTRTPLHELGHVLGLLHEHQRYDRDLYLDFKKRPDIDLESVNYKKYPKEIEKTVFVWKWVPVQIAFIKLTMLILAPVVGSEAYSYVTGQTLDFDSIMLYNGLPINSHYGSRGVWDEYDNCFVTKFNSALSTHDIEAVLGIYKK